MRAAVLFAAGAVMAAACAVRYGLVEPADVTLACESQPWRGWCALRSLAIAAFIDQRIGAFALGAAVLATLTRWRWLAGLALAAGCAGLILYSAGLSAPAVLLAALVWVVPRAPAALAAGGPQGPRPDDRPRSAPV